MDTRRTVGIALFLSGIVGIIAVIYITVFATLTESGYPAASFAGLAACMGMLALGNHLAFSATPRRRP